MLCIFNFRDDTAVVLPMINSPTPRDPDSNRHNTGDH